MKTNILILIFLILVQLGGQSQTIEFVDNFNDNSLLGNWGVTGNAFALTESDSVLKITYNRTSTSGQWDQFHLNGISVNVDNHPNLSIDIKSDVYFVLAVKPVNSNESNDWLEVGIPNDNKWHTYAFQLYNSLGSPITKVYIYFDGGSTSIKSGNVEFDNFDLGILSLPVDTTLLFNVVDAAKKLKDFIVEGTDVGQYPVGSKVKLQSAIDIGDTLIAHKDSYTQGYIDTAANSLFDSITDIEKSVILDTHPLVDTMATMQTVYLYKNLQYISSKHHVLYGQHNTLANGVGWYDDGTASKSDAMLVTGSHPVVNSQDANNIVGNSSAALLNFKNRQIKTYTLGGVNTLCWHMFDPAYGKIYYEDLNTAYNVVASILPGGIYNTWYKNNLWHLALYLKSLRGNNGEVIPVIFRPFHEHNGTWFWWGKDNCTTVQYDSIWQYTQQYLRDSLNVHSLIYAISPDGGQFTTKAEYKSIYPGDEYVDIFGLDYYFRTISLSAKNLLMYQLNYIIEYADASNKLAALTEFGDLYNGSALMNIPYFYTSRLLSAVKSNSKSSRISYMASWSNASTGSFFAPYPGQTQVPDFLDFYDDTTTLFMNDLVELYDSLLNDEFEKTMQGCRIKTFSLKNTAGTFDTWQPGKTLFNITVNIPDTVSDISAIVPLFTNSEGSVVKVNNVVQTSGTSAQNFTDTVEYVVVAQDNIDSSVYSVVVKKVPVAGISNISDLDLIMYPNPVSTILHISNTRNVSKIEIHNLIGIKTDEILVNNGNRLTIDMNKYTKGIYLLSVYNKNGTVKVMKLIKK